MSDTLWRLTALAAVAWHEAHRPARRVQADDRPQGVPGPPAPDCPHCDTALRPEPIAPRVWLCSCCSSVFEVPTP